MNKIDLKNKVAVVTGGAQGFGRAIVEKFLASDAKVIIWDKDKEMMSSLNLGDNVNVNETTQNDISIYPNPSNGVINITNNGTNKNSIIVRDISGKVILSTNSNVNATIDLSKYGKGIYIVEVSNSVGTITEKVTIQ